MNKEHIDLSKISTEQQNPRTLEIDRVAPTEIARLINEEDKLPQQALSKCLSELGQAIESCAKSVASGGRIIYIGAGTSGRIGVLDASEMPPTYGVSKQMFIGLIAGGDRAIKDSVENAEDNREAGVQDLKDVQLSSKDVVIGLAASGRTPYVVAALEYANSLGATTIAISTSENTLIGKIAKIKIEAVTGPEPITGSTRMKSGTAQKMAVNIISTGTMITLGKVYGNLMVDVKTSNAKLTERAILMVQKITSCDYETARQQLEKAGMNVKIASIMIKKQTDAGTAQKLANENTRLSDIIDCN